MSPLEEFAAEVERIKQRRVRRSRRPQRRLGERDPNHLSDLVCVDPLRPFGPEVGM